MYLCYDNTQWGRGYTWLEKTIKNNWYLMRIALKRVMSFQWRSLNHGLTLNQMQLLAYAIYCTQQDGSTEFIKADFERKFGLKRYKTEDAYKDSEKVSALRYSTQNLEEKKFSFTAIFTESSI